MRMLIELAILVGVCVLVVVFSMIMTRCFILPLLGIDWTTKRRVKAPWRFSIKAITVLIALAACVCALLRDSPPTAVVATLLIAVMWFAVVRFLELRRELTERRKKAFAGALDEVLGSHPDARAQA